jgi:hypothetical protein
VLATAAGRRLAAARGGLAAGGLAALAAEQTGGGLLLFANHRVTNQGHQHGDRRHNNTIHLQTPQFREQRNFYTLTVASHSVPNSAATVFGGGATLYRYS